MGLEQRHNDADGDTDASNPTHPTLNTIDFNLQIGVEEILTDVDPDVSLEFLQKAEAHSGKPPPTRVSREVLVSTHNDYVEQQQKSGQQNGPRMVKKVVLALSYPPSVKSVVDLSPVRSPPRHETIPPRIATA